MGLAFIAIISIYISLSDSQGDILPSLGIFAIGLQRLLPCLQQCYCGWAAYKGSVFDLMYVLEASSPNNFSPPRYLTTNSISKVFRLKILVSNIPLIQNLSLRISVLTLYQETYMAFVEEPNGKIYFS